MNQSGAACVWRCVDGGSGWVVVARGRCVGPTLGWDGGCSFFFFSSRRRHTRCSRDWSSDVCSSDLIEHAHAKLVRRHPHVFGETRAHTPEEALKSWNAVKATERAAGGQADSENDAKKRSEERRVGKECRSRWSPDH